jgi:hypothetical protein
MISSATMGMMTVPSSRAEIASRGQPIQIASPGMVSAFSNSMRQ